MSDIYRRFLLFPDILIMLVLLIGISSYTIAQPFHWSILLFFCLGLIVFSFSEYLTHRFLFHLPPPKNALGRKLLKRLHYDHHAHPNELHLLFLPIWYSLPNLGFFAGLTYILTFDTVYRFDSGSCKWIDRHVTCLRMEALCGARSAEAENAFWKMDEKDASVASLQK